MPFGSDADLEFRLGLGKDPSIDKVLSEIPRDAERKLGGRMKKVLGSIDMMGRDVFSRLGRLSTSVFAAAGAGGLGYELKNIANLDRATHQLGRAAKLTATAEKALGDAIKQNAVDTGVAREDQIAALQLLQDRYAVVNQLAEEGTLDQQLELASLMTKGFNMELTTSMDLLGALNQTAGLTGDQLADSMAFLEQASQMGSMGFKELGGVMSELLGEASALGQSGETAVRDVVAITEATTATIKETERARTYVRGFISRLGQADVGEKMMKNLGVATTDAQGNFRRLSVIVQETLEALDKLSDAEKAAQVKDIFGSEESMAVLKALSGKGRGTFEGIVDLQVNSENFMDYLAEQADSAATEFEKLTEQVRLLIDEAIEPLLEAIVDHGDGIKGMAEWIAKNPLKTGFAVLFGPTAVKALWGAVAKKIAAGGTAGTIGKALSDGMKGAGVMNVTANVVNVAGGKGGLPGGGRGTASQIGSGAAQGLGWAGKLLNWKSIALAGELGLPAGAMLKMLGPAALAPGLGAAAMIGGGAAVGAGTLAFVGAGLSDYSKRYSKQSAANVWTRAEALGDEGREEFRERYYALDEDKRTADILNKILDELQAQSKQEQKVKVKVDVNSGSPDSPPVDYSVL